MASTFTNFVPGTKAKSVEVNKNFHLTGCPIGTVLPWLKTLTNTPSLPDGWVECDGSTVSDGDSVYNGVTLPDLTDTFLRGAATSGGTGGSDTHQHISPVGRNLNNSEIMFKNDFASEATETSTHIANDVDTAALIHWGSSAQAESFSYTKLASTLPAYYAVVMIIRIR